MRGNKFVVALGVGVLLVVSTACSAAVPQTQAPPPQIPRITPSTTPSRVPVMVDRALPDDCELVVPVEVMNTTLGQELPGEPRIIVGIKEPGIGRTGKIDCYYGIPDKKGLTDAKIVIGLSSYTDDLTARTRVSESVEAERADGAKITEVDVGKQKGTLVEGKDEQLLIGSLGKSTFVVRNRNNFIPKEKLIAILPVLAAQSMTPPV
ncbi:hypothetical protein [Lentzea flaviverrucosa]|uniref:DUF5642 domain-containing protein n=1 Tax=Lentzea flaviverrucosa TaxID=200379 RepID=A0A1H9UZY8_9PSEU|nr:hypothetical protein [Lentzea flaviverrucosa]RDI27633.1 hypothetical protein DFR72_106117 [Lentzea flaviverrucosa]SES14909.1 hypothetical protein SAMN05216195_109228 [Lentzea flaviverrucosa]